MIDSGEIEQDSVWSEIVNYVPELYFDELIDGEYEFKIFDTSKAKFKYNQTDKNIQYIIFEIKFIVMPQLMNVYMGHKFKIQFPLEGFKKEWYFNDGWLVDMRQPFEAIIHISKAKEKYQIKSATLTSLETGQIIELHRRFKKNIHRKMPTKLDKVNDKLSRNITIISETEARREQFIAESLKKPTSH
jgi:hypothetical protein